MPVMKEDEEIKHFFQKAAVLAESGIMKEPGKPQTSGQVAQQKQSILAIDEQKYKMLVPFIKPLQDPEGATELEKLGLAKRIFETIAAGGGFGIVYDYNSDKRLPKTPDEVLVKDNGAYRADCDELAFTFLAVAKRAGLGIRSFQFVEFTFEVQSLAGKKIEEKHAAVIQIDSNTYVLELTRPKDGFSPLPDASLESLKKYYVSKKIEGTEGIITNVKSLQPRITEQEVEASFHAERARVLNNRGNALAAIREYEIVLSLDKKYEGISDQLVRLYFVAAEVYAKTDVEREAYYKKALKVTPQDYRVNFQMGVFYAEIKKDKNLDEAIQCFEKAAELQPASIPLLENLLFCYSQRGYFDKQIECAKKLLTIDEYNVGAYVYLVSGYIGKAKAAEKTDHSKSVTAYQDAMKYCEMGLKHAKSGSEEFLELKAQREEIKRRIPSMH